MKRLHGVLVALLSAATLAACSGNASSGGERAALLPSYVPGPMGRFKAALWVPSKHSRHGRSVARSLHPAYLPARATEVDFLLVSVNGTPVNEGTPPPNWVQFVLSTSGCSQGGVGNGYVCMASEPAPAGTDVYQIVSGACSSTPLAAQTCAASGGVLTPLSETLATVVIPANGTGSAAFTLNPIVGGMHFVSSVSAVGFGTGTKAPAFDPSTSTYSCSTQCYDPILNGDRTPSYDSLTLQVTDEEGETIVPASGGLPVSGGGGSFYPIYLTASGAVDTFYVTCNDTAVEWVTAVAAASGPIAAASVNIGDIATGFSNGTWVSPSGAFDSPLPRSFAGNTGTDFSGASHTIASNDGAAVNFDASRANYALGAFDTCTATDASTPPLSASYFLGFGFGGINWGANTRFVHL